MPGTAHYPMRVDPAIVPTVRIIRLLSAHHPTPSANAIRFSRIIVTAYLQGILIRIADRRLIQKQIDYIAMLKISGLSQALI
ncbi:hypothetical protein IJT17_09540, partial [bacterium]|nr:hypothetical protein [bacterium]